MSVKKQQIVVLECRQNNWVMFDLRVQIEQLLDFLFACKVSSELRWQMPTDKALPINLHLRDAATAIVVEAVSDHRLVEQLFADPAAEVCDCEGFKSCELFFSLEHDFR